MTDDRASSEAVVFIYVTNPSKRGAARIAKNLMDKKLVVCANMFPIESIYPWEGKIVEGKEYALILKTVREKSGQVEEAVKEMHPYKVPCIITVPVSPNKEFGNWLRTELGP
jgi:periplasmic divalent cation tolerance protein